MSTPAKNPAAVSLGRLGGSAKSERKKAANAANARRLWDKIRAGLVPHPREKRST